MFAPAATPLQAAQAFAGAYRQVSVETGVAGASPHGLIAMLFAGFNDAVNQTRSAMQSGDIEAKGKAILRAVRIVDEGLKAALDVRAGGKLAEDLGALYAYVTMRLTQANLNNDTAALDECVRLIEPVRSAWMAIGTGTGSPAATAAKVQ